MSGGARGRGRHEGREKNAYGRPRLKDYFECVTLGAFSFRDEKKLRRFFTLTGSLKARYIALQLLVASLALNFPLTLAVARLSPFELYSRLYGGNFTRTLPDEMKTALSANDSNAAVDNSVAVYNSTADDAIADSMIDDQFVENFNLVMAQNHYGRNTLLPLLAFIFGVTLVLQAAFYGMACFFMGLQRMHSSRLSYKERLAILAFSSTLPVFLSALLGLWIPTLHIIVFYFAVILTATGRAKFDEAAEQTGTAI